VPQHLRLDVDDSSDLGVDEDLFTGAQLRRQDWRQLDGHRQRRIRNLDPSQRPLCSGTEHAPIGEPTQVWYVVDMSTFVREALFLVTILPVGCRSAQTPAVVAPAPTPQVTKTPGPDPNTADTQGDAETSLDHRCGSGHARACLQAGLAY
jgi:hypothetical protein